MNTLELVGKKMNYEGILGMVIKFDSPIVYFSTPHGTVLKMGWFHYVSDVKELTSEDEKQLEIYENQVKEQGEIPYESNFSKKLLKLIMNNLTKKDFDKIQKYRISAYTQEPNEVGGYIFHKKFHEKIWIGDIDKIIQLNNLVLWKKNKKEWLMRNPDALYFKNDKHFFCFEYYTEPTQEEIDKMLEGL